MRKAVASLVLAVCSILGVLTLTPSVAGAVPVPCPVGNQGWFEGTSNVYHCTVDGNHIVIARYDVNGLADPVAWEAWVPSWTTIGFRGGAFGSAYGLIEACANLGGNYQSEAFWRNEPYWQHGFYLYSSSVGVVGVEGHVHWDNTWLDLDEYGWPDGPIDCGEWGHQYRLF